MNFGKATLFLLGATVGSLAGAAATFMTMTGTPSWIAWPEGRRVAWNAVAVIGLFVLLMLVAYAIHQVKEVPAKEGKP